MSFILFFAGLEDDIFRSSLAQAAAVRGLTKKRVSVESRILTRKSMKCGGAARFECNVEEGNVVKQGAAF